MLIKYLLPMVVGGTLARIGPHRLEIDLPPEFGNRPPATQNGDAPSSQQCAVNDAFLLRVHHVCDRGASPLISYPARSTKNSHVAGSQCSRVCQRQGRCCISGSGPRQAER